jgi:hypothetical protein
MSLKIYSEALPTSYYTVSGDFGNPFITAIDGREGGTVERLLYVRNDSATYVYSGIFVQPVVLTGRNIVDGTDGFYWKVKAGATQPTDQEWTTISGGVAIDIGDLGSAGAADTSTYLPFWLKQAVPAGVNVQSFTGTILRITATEIVA